jgi:predicted ATPase
VRVLEEHLQSDRGVVLNRVGANVTFGGGGHVTIDVPGPLLPMLNIRGGDDSLRQVRSFFASMVILSPVPGSMGGYGEEESNELREDGSNVAAWVKAIQNRPSRIAQMIKYLGAVMPDFDEFIFEERGKRGFNLSVRFESKGAVPSAPLLLDFKQLSDGEKCFFLSAAVVALNSSETPVFCFWDEPDNHLSLSEVSHFIIELRRMSNRGGQFLATSHHPETIRRFSDENTLVFTRNSHLEPTVVRPLSELKYTGDLIAAIGRGEVIE